MNTHGHPLSHKQHTHSPPCPHVLHTGILLELTDFCILEVLAVTDQLGEVEQQKEPD
jgi:hypothetical protein